MRLLILLIALFAPVPPYRPKSPQPVSVVGTWRMHWGSVVYDSTHFARDGYYECQRRWEGRWKIEDGRLSVVEWAKGDTESSPIEWSVRLDPGRLAGRAESGFPFKLEKGD